MGTLYSQAVLFPEPEAITFGQKMKRVRVQSGLSVQELMMASGVNRSHIVETESGKRPPAENVMRKLGQCSLWPVSYEEMKWWKILDDFQTPEEVLRFASAVQATVPNQQQPLHGSAHT